eukprot:Nk52_evm1s1423 gene=Nk52_evmTU1s1423
MSHIAAPSSKILLVCLLGIFFLAALHATTVTAMEGRMEGGLLGNAKSCDDLSERERKGAFLEFLEDKYACVSRKIKTQEQCKAFCYADVCGMAFSELRDIGDVDGHMCCVCKLK